MSAQDLHQLDVTGLAAKLAAREVSSVEVTQALLDRAQAHADLGAYLALNEEASLAQARAADDRLAAGVRRAATAAAEPPEEPPGTARLSQGFFTAPKAEFSLDEPMANSSMFSLPSVTTPACLSLVTTVASKGLA